MNNNYDTRKKTISRGVPVPNCDALLVELFDYAAAARQLDKMLEHVFKALRSETDFSPVYLGPKAVKQYGSWSHE